MHARGKQVAKWSREGDGENEIRRIGDERAGGVKRGNGAMRVFGKQAKGETKGKEIANKKGGKDNEQHVNEYG